MIEYFTTERKLKERLVKMGMDGNRIEIGNEEMMIDGEKKRLYKLNSSRRVAADYVLSQEEIDDLLYCLANGEFGDEGGFDNDY